MAPKAIKYGSYEEIIKQGDRIAVLPEVFYEKIPQELRRISFTVSNISRIDTIQAILDSLNKYDDFDTWKDKVTAQEFIDLAEAQKKTIFRTNMITQYNNGRLQVAQNSDSLKYLKYQAVIDENTRPNHAANDGVTLPFDDPFWLTNTPPLGYNCRCIVLNLHADDLKDNPLTDKQTLNQDMAPDEGFDNDVRNQEPVLAKVLRDKISNLPTRLQPVAFDRFLQKDSDTLNWWKNNKKSFVKK